MISAIVGSSLGDEGKGKITDAMAADADVCVRFQGGANAGHTIVNEHGKFALHLLPSGVFNPKVTNVIGNGVALDAFALEKEVNDLKERGVDNFKLLVSNRCQFLMSYHVLFDRLEEERLGKDAFGSTKSGIAPFYSDKYAKTGFQIGEMYEGEEYIKAKIERVLAIKNTLLKNLYNHEELKAEDIYDELTRAFEIVKPYLADTARFLRDAEKSGKNILLEGQLGTLKDPDFGIYPMVTSSSPLAGYATVGAGVAPYSIKRIVAVVKAYSSSVGAGEFVTRMYGEEEKFFRTHGAEHEVGAKTGRLRAIGWLDAVSLRYGCETQGATEIALTVLDALSQMEKIPVCVAYSIDGKIVTDFPTTAEFKRAVPIYKTLDGWNCDIKGVTKYEDLPKNCRDYIEFIEKEIGIPITMVCNGPARENILYR